MVQSLVREKALIEWHLKHKSSEYPVVTHAIKARSSEYAAVGPGGSTEGERDWKGMVRLSLGKGGVCGTC